MTPDELFDAWERAWSGRDLNAFEPLVTDDVHYEDPLTPEPLDGVEALAKHAWRLWRGFPDARLNSTGDRLARGPFAVAPARLLGTHRRPVAGLAATHRALEVHVVFYAELREGRMWRVRAFYDLYGAAVQLGVLPRAGTPGERALRLLRGFGLTR